MKAGGMFARVLPMGLALAALLSLQALGATTFELVPAYPEQPLLGPQAAKGAVIWSHGMGFQSDNARSSPPQYLSLLRQAGWDVYRQNRIDEFQEYNDPRANAERDMGPKAEALSESADKRKSQGYRKVVLAGQSYGSWLSLLVADRRKDLYAVIAMAPAAYGSVKADPIRYGKNAAVLYGFLEEIEGGRVLLGYFRDDIFEPEDRAARSERILASDRVPHLIIDHPDAPTGHGGANGRYFAWRFGSCAVAFLEAADIASPDACEFRSPPRPSADIAIPHDLKLATPQNGSPINPFLGRWYGVYPNGREVVFAIERVDNSDVQANYVFGRLDTSPPGANHRHGRLDGGRLVFTDGSSRLEYRLKADGMLEGKWSRGNTALVTILRRLPQQTVQN